MLSTVQSWEIVCLIFAAVVVILLFSLQRKLDHKARSASLSPCLFPLSVSFSHWGLTCFHLRSTIICLLVPLSTLSFMGQFGYCEAIPISPTIILVYLLQAASGLLEGYGQDAPTTTSYEHNYKCVVGDRSRFCKGAAGYCNSASTGVCNCFINRHAVSCSLILCVSPSHPVLIVHLSIPCYRRDAAKLAPLHWLLLIWGKSFAAKCHLHFWVHVCRWVQGDALNLPFRDCSFDAITMGYGLRNVASIPLALQEIHRVLKPGMLHPIL